jgi:DNA/RNA-binding domain of Phe-tRNA-synthetase-like protein
MSTEAPVGRGWIEPMLQEEFNGLALVTTDVEARPGRSPRELRQRLRHLSDKVHGAHALAQRREPIASSYRIFFRQIGIDPEESRPPAEAAMLERLRAGWFRSRNLLDDALLVALVETGVAVRAFDSERLQGELGVRISRPQERLGGTGLELPDGTIVIADERDSVALIFGETAPGRAVVPETTRIKLAAVQVQGVPDISVEEALWTASDILASG